MDGGQHSRQGMTIASFNKESMDRTKLLRRLTTINVYMVDLPNWMGISKTFNVVDLILFQSYMTLGYPEVTQGQVPHKWRCLIQALNQIN